MTLVDIEYYSATCVNPPDGVNAIDWLKSGREKDKPFLLMVQHKAPHRAWMPALRHLDLLPRS